MNHSQTTANWTTAIGAILLLLSPQVSAQSKDDDISLREQVQKLQRALAAVQKRLDVIEADRHSEPASATQPNHAAANPSPTGQNTGTRGVTTRQAPGPTLTPQRVENWSALHRGMNPEQVKALLGQSDRNFKLSGQTVWYYYYTGVGGGSVVFSRVKNTLLDWQPPPFHTWW